MTEFTAALFSAHRDALVAYYLGQIVPEHPVPGARRLETPEDLYEYLLIDNQVNTPVDTSLIAMGMASLQQYIHAIYNGMEPGYRGIFDKQAQQLWRESKSEYAIWAGNQMLQDYPENYIEPTLRLHQTQAFTEFTNDINQSRPSKESVQNALRHYLNKFEHLSNLNVVSGYIDGVDFRNADYYFLGRQNVEPYQYFWRKAQVRFGEATGQAEGDDYLSPTAWSEWLPVNIPSGSEILHIRPLLLDGRLYVAWISQQEKMRERPDGDDVVGTHESVPSYSLNVAYQMIDGSWSPAMVTVLKDKRKYDPDADYFVAFVSEADPDDKKIVFAYGVTDADQPDYEGLIFDARFNVLFHDVVNHTCVSGYLGKMLNALQHFSNADNSLQHPLASDRWTHPAVTQGYEEAYHKVGALSGWMRLVTWFCIDKEGRYCLRVRGQVTKAFINATTERPHNAHLILSCYVSGVQKAGAEFRDIALNGNAWTPDVMFVFGAQPGDIPSTIDISFGDVASTPSRDHYVVTLNALPEARPKLRHEATGGQFLDLTALRLTGLQYVRLNTLFARDLVAKANVSVDAVLNWSTQHMQEPPLPGSTAVSYMDFHGANGRYFWELFFHVPHAVAQRLHNEFDFFGAEEWLHYIFNPQAKIKPTQPPSPLYWSVRPLEEASSGDYEVVGITDPDAICYSHPEHYRKAIFTLYVRNLMAYGDSLYRRLTRDSLNEAKLMYVRALSLMGNKPDNRMVGRWEPVSLGVAAEMNGQTFARYEHPLSARSLPAIQGEDRPWFELLDSERFRLPVNTQLLDIWDDIARRLENLRNNLTIDGKPLLLPLYAPPVDPKMLLRAQNSASGLVQRSVGGMAPIPPYRFRALLPRVQNAVETLIRFGEQVRTYRELKDRAEQEELQQSHVLELSQFGIKLQELAIDQADAGLVALTSSRQVIKQRFDYYSKLAEENVSSAEERAKDLNLKSAIASAGTQALERVAGAVNMGSVIVTAVGGGHTRAGSAVQAVAVVAGMAADSMRIDGEMLSINEQYRRRLVEWEFQRDQASAELSAVDKQINVQKLQIESAREQLAHAVRSEQQSQDYYAFLKTRSTNAGLYQWLLSQLSTFYFQAYDAVVALSLNLEACWQYELGDFQTRFIQPNVWFENYFGLTAGDALKLQLLRMEAAYLKRNERRLELTKTVSLKSLFEKIGSKERWEMALTQLKERGELTFDLHCSLFDGDYPGHYLRQLVSVSVSLPVVVGPYQQIHGVLTQVSSKTVTKADLRAMNSLYGLPDAKTQHILFNPRASQSIALSSGMDDHGLFMLDFNDERYLPFEGTGAVSSWQLKFPRHDRAPQSAMLDTLTDIIVNLRYTAVDGGPGFASQVEGLLDQM